MSLEAFVALLVLSLLPIFSAGESDVCREHCVNGLSTRYLNFSRAQRKAQPCICDDGFGGRFCNEPIFKCLYGGTPLLNGICRCQDSREGSRCESERCYHGISSRGVHFDDSHPSPCICDVGYTGRHCELHMSSQCGAHGRLYVGREDDGCVCDDNYEGANCDRLKNCNHGEDEGGRCECNKGWRGKACDQIDCEHGRPINNRTRCECIADHIGGLHCDVCKMPFEEPPHCGIKPPTTPFSIVTFAFVGIIGCISVFLILAACILHRHSHWKQWKKMLHDSETPLSQQSLEGSISEEIESQGIPDDPQLSEEELRERISLMEKKLKSLLTPCGILPAPKELESVRINPDSNSNEPLSVDSGFDESSYRSDASRSNYENKSAMPSCDSTKACSGADTSRSHNAFHLTA